MRPGLIAPAAVLAGIFGIVRAYALTIPEDTAIAVIGVGCMPGAQVTVWGEARHASARDIATLTADSRGSFSGQVVVPFMGDGTAIVEATCID
jgi:hypothetical protein